MILDTCLPPRLQKKAVGHSFQWEFLSQKILSKKVHPAWVFSGNKGIGKATFSYQLIRLILEQEGVSPSFIETLISEKSHPNLLIIEKRMTEEGKIQNEITVDDIRKIADFAHHCAAFPGWRIVFIDPLEDLNRNAAHALLKILEEPPQKMLIFMTTHAIGRVLPTLRSRCCVLPFYPLGVDELTNITQSTLSPLVIELAGGSLAKTAGFLKINLELLLDNILKALEKGLKNQWNFAQKFILTLGEKSQDLPLLPELLLWISSQFVLIQSGGGGCEALPLLTQVAESRSVKYWIFVYEHLSHFIAEAQSCHLDMTSFSFACFLCFESPHLFQRD